MPGQVTFTPTRRLYVQWNRFAMYKVMRARGALLVALAILLGASAILLLATGLVRHGGLAAWVRDGSPGSTFGVLVAPFAIALVLLLPWLQGRRWASIPGMLEPQKVAWTDTGITHTRGGVVTAIGWDAVTKVLQDAHNVYVITGQGKAIVAGLPIPRAAFASAPEADLFVAEARSLAAGSRPAAS